jgi:hypothetical protein
MLNLWLFFFLISFIFSFYLLLCRSLSIILPHFQQRTQYLVKDIKGLQTTLTLCRSGSVFVRSDNNRLDVMKAVIIGPEGGFLLFSFTLVSLQSHMQARRTG